MHLNITTDIDKSSPANFMTKLDDVESIESEEKGN